jgi:hypothetical protein
VTRTRAARAVGADHSRPSGRESRPRTPACGGNGAARSGTLIAPATSPACSVANAKAQTLPGSGLRRPWRGRGTASATVRRPGECSPPERRCWRSPRPRRGCARRRRRPRSCRPAPSRPPPSRRRRSARPPTGSGRSCGRRRRSAGGRRRRRPECSGHGREGAAVTEGTGGVGPRIVESPATMSDHQRHRPAPPEAGWPAEADGAAVVTLRFVENASAARCCAPRAGACWSVTMIGRQP